MMSRNEIVCTGFLAVALFFLVFPIVSPQSHNRSRRMSYRRMGDMKQIGLGLLIYSGENQGAFPPDLWTLEDQGMLDGRTLAAPADSPDFPQDDPLQISGRNYYMGAGLRDDYPAASTTALLVSPFYVAGRYVMYVLFIDGRVGYYQPDNNSHVYEMISPMYVFQNKVQP